MKDNIFTILAILLIVCNAIALINIMVLNKKYSYTLTNYYFNGIMICLMTMLYINPNIWLLMGIYATIISVVLLRRAETQVIEVLEKSLTEYGRIQFNKDFKKINNIKIKE